MGFFSSIAKGFKSVIKSVATIAIVAAAAYFTGGASLAWTAAAMTTALTFVGGALTPTPKSPEPLKDPGIRQQLAPNTTNKLPVVYGRAYVKGIIVDARISSDNKTMWYVLALCEKTTTGNWTWGNVYWNDIRMTVATNATISSAASGENPNKNLYADFSGVKIYRYSGNSETRYQNSTQYGYAYNIVPGWDSTWMMNNTIFAVVEMKYSAEKNITSLPQITFELENSLKDPGLVWYDYMTNTRYGAGIPAEEIDADSSTNNSVTYIVTET